MRVDQHYIAELMELALDQAQRAFSQGEVPVGAVIADRNGVIATAHNEVESLNDPTAHAEALAIRRAAAKLGRWRLNDLVLVSTLEPCTMCCGAIKLARLPVIAYGACDERAGAFGSLYDLSVESGSGLVPRVISGVQTERCVALLRDFFKENRENAVGHHAVPLAAHH